MTIHSRHDEFQHQGEPESELVRGRLMAIDWATGTARLDTPKGDSVMLRFSASDIDLENRFRKLATCHVDVKGNRVDSKEHEAISVLEIDHAWLEPEPPKEPNDGPLTDEDWDSWMLAISEGRDGLCGECRRRAPVE